VRACNVGMRFLFRELVCKVLFGFVSGAIMGAVCASPRRIEFNAAGSVSAPLSAAMFSVGSGYTGWRYGIGYLGGCLIAVHTGSVVTACVFGEVVLQWRGDLCSELLLSYSGLAHSSRLLREAGQIRCSSP
jgi:hypothetical protein